MDEMNNLKSFWSGKRVFITGNTGFKGSWLSLIMLNLGAEVKGFSLKHERDKSLYFKLKLEENSNNTYGDIRNEKFLSDELRLFKPEIVFHMAAQPLVRRSYVEPLETISTNVVGTFNVLQACRSVDSIKSIISVTTDKCYLNKEWEYSYRENDNLGGHDPYSASKACAEIITSSMRDSFYKDREIGISTEIYDKIDGQPFNYGLYLDGTNNCVSTSVLKLNGQERFAEMDGYYFNYLQTI